MPVEAWSEDGKLVYKYRRALKETSTEMKGFRIIVKNEEFAQIFKNAGMDSCY